MGINLIYCIPIGGSCVLNCSNLEKYGNCRFSGRIWPDWGNTTWAEMTGLESIGLKQPTLGKSYASGQSF